MVVVMVVMVWLWGVWVLMMGFVVFFLLVVVWFGVMVVVVVCGIVMCGLYGYYGLMMLVIVWMYVVMNFCLFFVCLCIEYVIELDGLMLVMDMIVMNMLLNSGLFIWFSVVNWIGMVGFVVVVVFWVCRFVMEWWQEVIQFRLLGSIG